MAKLGIYIITNTKNGKVYIGSTSNLKKRQAYHNGDLRRGTHGNPHLQRAWDKYGEGAFEFGVLEYLDDPGELHLAEQFWMDLYREEGTDLYNCGLVARSPVLGRKHTEEARRKISEANKGKSPSEATRRKISKTLSGCSHPPISEKTRRRMSEAQRGNQKPARPYPAFIHKESGKIIPAGVNLAATCRKYMLARNHMWEIVHGKRISHKGWRLYNKQEAS